jgi:magnesium-transporting ATPase (P-type)
MVLISVVGVEEKLRKNAVQTVRFAIESGLKPWILSGDRFINVLPVAHKTKILDRSVPNVMFDSGDHEEIKALIRNNLQIMNN